MKLSQGVATVLLMAIGAVAQAEITGTVTAVSDYDFRGITQTSKDPALQGSDPQARYGLAFVCHQVSFHVTRHATPKPGVAPCSGSPFFESWAE